ncbi:MAG: anaerobic ribonucleoside-triphosphate reductase activating protein [Candidatus Zixiibacteriota bacterium]|jgi:pyruvate formate lyase activating enzyme
MIVGGFQRFSLIDYPGKSSAVVFTRGCNFRCRYCHNPELVIPEEYAPEIPLSEIFGFLERRRNRLDAVCVTGGEPTEHADLAEVLAGIKDMGFSVKLDTNGGRPEALEAVVRGGLVDYLAMDIKAPLDDYARVTGRPASPEIIKRSIDLIMNSGVEYEFRTTVAAPLIRADDLIKIGRTIEGAERYYIQNFVPSKSIDAASAGERPYPAEVLRELAGEMENYVARCGVR